MKTLKSNYFAYLALVFVLVLMGCGSASDQLVDSGSDGSTLNSTTGGSSAATATGGSSAFATGGSATEPTDGHQSTSTMASTGGSGPATGGSAAMATGGSSAFATGGKAATGGASSSPAPNCGLYVLTPYQMASTIYFCVCGSKWATLNPPAFPAGCTTSTASSGGVKMIVTWGTCEAHLSNVFSNGQDATGQANGGYAAQIYGFDTVTNCSVGQAQLGG